ncbi:hypothetical protein SCA6_010510 [Theobroma cacao]
MRWLKWKTEISMETYSLDSRRTKKLTLIHLDLSKQNQCSFQSYSGLDKRSRLEEEKIQVHKSIQIAYSLPRSDENLQGMSCQYDKSCTNPQGQSLEDKMET